MTVLIFLLGVLMVAASGRLIAHAIALPRLKLKQHLIELEEQDWGGQATMRATVEREGGDKPVCVAETVFRYYT